jgi:putative redox protein
MSAKAPTRVDLRWTGDLRFTVTFPPTETPPFVLDSAGAAGPSPVSALAASLAGCMGMDLVHILTGARHEVHDVQAHLEGERAQSGPHRFLRIRLHFVIGGVVPVHAVERAITLSRDKYCSVWHSLRPDIDLQVTFEQHA